MIERRKMMSKVEPKTVLIIDGHNMAYRAYYKFSQLATLDGKNTSITYGIPFILRSLIDKFQPDMVVTIFDGGRSKHRIKLLKTYKGTRGNKLDFDREDFERQKDEVIRGLVSMGIPVAMNKGEEADDLIYMALKVFLKQKIETNIIVSSDKDFNQLATSREVIIFNPSTGDKVTVHNCSKLKGYEPKQTVDFLCLTGDKSDNIPGLDGVGEKRAIQFLQKYGSIKKYINDKSIKEERLFPREKLREVYRRNAELIGLRRFYIKHMANKSINWVNNMPFPRFNSSEYVNFCIKNQLSSFNEKAFMQSFKSLNTRMFKMVKK